MYTKLIKFEKFVRGIWVEQSLRTTDDAIWLHLETFRIATDIKNVVVVDNV